MRPLAKPLLVFSPNRKPNRNPSRKPNPKPHPSLTAGPNRMPQPTLMRNPSRELSRNPNRKPKRNHERHHGELAPKDQQRRRSSVRRPHDESPGRFEYRTIREVGACIGRLLSDRGIRVGRMLSRKRARSPDGKAKRASRCRGHWGGGVRVRPGTGGTV